MRQRDVIDEAVDMTIAVLRTDGYQESIAQPHTGTSTPAPVRVGMLSPGDVSHATSHEVTGELTAAISDHHA